MMHGMTHLMEFMYRLVSVSLSHSRKMAAISCLVKMWGTKPLRTLGRRGTYDAYPITCR